MKKMIEKVINLRVWLILAVAAFSISSCLKDDNNGYSVQVAGVALINAAPGSGALDFISDGNRNYLPTTFAYDTVLSYRSAYPGFRVFGVTRHNSNELLGSQQFYLEPGVAYSLFVTDTIGDIKLALLKDSLGDQDSTMATIRFANMSADAPELSLELSSGSQSSTVKTVAFGKASKFSAVAPGEGYTLKLINSGTQKVIATKTGIDLKKAKIYTFWSKGIFSSTDNKTKIGLAVMENG